ncbi:hypothetical protein B0T26DRAFT_117920 [Lasiosphaeria miniovina]|uniref:Uncharacterized protein n=1 Tax=Lasiosphaeria miniovina TaxID=1954250 RepID=A0AA40E7R1_9PEZI|nr:uncharacterized protein B0T26DRAFT_117920 [Lasiosphaeria miniovina]KAK0727116.1 hypothetical protein B0T26DRAFT_117920 [Lasiosphaeria miniovina]
MSHGRTGLKRVGYQAVLRNEQEHDRCGCSSVEVEVDERQVGAGGRGGTRVVNRVSAYGAVRTTPLALCIEEGVSRCLDFPTRPAWILYVRESKSQDIPDWLHKKTRPLPAPPLAAGWPWFSLVWSRGRLSLVPYAGRFRSHPRASDWSVVDHGVRCPSEPLHDDLHRGLSGPGLHLCRAPPWACVENKIQRYGGGAEGCEGGCEVEGKGVRGRQRPPFCGPSNPLEDVEHFSIVRAREGTKRHLGRSSCEDLQAETPRWGVKLLLGRHV